MRSHFSFDWAVGIRGAIENVIRQDLPSQLRQWPLLQSFDFEAYQVGENYLVMIMRDRLLGVPAGPGDLKPFPHKDHPPLPVTTDSLSDWLSFLIDRFSLRTEDAAFILPIHDSGRHSASADYELFSDYEKALWDYQLQFTIVRQKSVLQAPVHSAPSAPTNVTYNVSGTNFRVNINSVDSSVNVVNEAPPEVFQKILATLDKSEADSDLVSRMETAVLEMQNSCHTKGFAESYKAFMAILADHIQVFGPLVAPYLPALAKLLS
jgi:hypothetical protein